MTIDSLIRSLESEPHEWNFRGGAETDILYYGEAPESYGAIAKAKVAVTSTGKIRGPFSVIELTRWERRRIRKAAQRLWRIKLSEHFGKPTDPPPMPQVEAYSQNPIIRGAEL